MSSGRNNTIGLRDARELYLLIGECRSLGRDGISWRRHLVERLPAIFDADMVFFLDNRVVGEPESPEGWVRPFSVVDPLAIRSEPKRVFSISASRTPRTHADGAHD